MGAYIRCCVNKYKYEQVFGNAKSCGKTDDSLRKKKAALGSKSGVDYAARRRRTVRADGVRGIERRSGGGNDIRVYLKRSENKSVAADFRGGDFTRVRRKNFRVRVFSGCAYAARNGALARCRTPRLFAARNKYRSFGRGNEGKRFGVFVRSGGHCGGGTACGSCGRAYLRGNVVAFSGKLVYYRAICAFQLCAGDFQRAARISVGRRYGRIRAA